MRTLSDDRRSTDEQKRRAVATHDEQAADFGARYDALAHDRYGSCFAYSRHRLHRLLDAHVPRALPGSRLLDVGCGTGHHLVDMRRRGFDVAGVDGAAQMVAQARVNNPGAPIALGDVDALPFRTAAFDVTLSVEVLRYVPDPRACLAELARVLRPGGVCLATAAPRLNLNGYWLVNRLATALPLPGFVRLKQYFATGAGLRRAFRAAGFADVKVHGVYVGPINWVERLAPRALPGVLRRWERLDAGLSDRPVVRELSNMFLVRAVKGP